MPWFDYLDLGWALGAVLSSALAGFILTSLWEREWRAALVTSILAFPASTGWFLILASVRPEGLRAGITLAGLALGVIFITLVALPLGRRGELRIVGEQERSGSMSAIPSSPAPAIGQGRRSTRTTTPATPS